MKCEMARYCPAGPTAPPACRNYGYISVRCRYGVVDDVVTFPGRMYAFVNYRSLDEALAAYETMQGQVVSQPWGWWRVI